MSGLGEFPSTSDTIVTEELCVELGEPCCAGEAVMLYWYNSLGGFENWQFGCRKKADLNLNDLGSFERYFADIQNQNERAIVLRREAQEVWTIADELVPHDFVEGLKEIMFSPLVYLYLEDTNQFLRVLVDKNSQNIVNFDAKAINFTFSIVLPKIQTVGN